MEKLIKIKMETICVENIATYSNKENGKKKQNFQILSALA